jgi:hypothetical protein
MYKLNAIEGGSMTDTCLISPLSVARLKPLEDSPRRSQPGAQDTGDSR